MKHGPTSRELRVLLEKQRTEHEIILDSVPALVFYKDKENRIVRANRALAEAMQLPREKMEGRTCFDLWPNQAAGYWADDLEVIRSGQPKRNIVERIDTPRGTRWLRTDKIPYKDDQGQTLGVIGFAVDITDLKRAEDEIRALSLVDELTGLYNRRGFVALAEQQLKIANRAKARLCLLYADLDNLKSTNDRLGHRQGDTLLRDMASILRATFRESDIVSRIGGDEFAVLLVNSDDPGSKYFAQRLREKVEARNAQQQDLHLSLSLGLADYYGDRPCPLADLLHSADRAMYQQKVAKRGDDPNAQV
ncbi:MAG: GGDEF domain-containing protein [Planctomycetes bacterium]|nr:GGDEF domain-containing protein [Planctomycetota bacterium]